MDSENQFYIFHKADSLSRQNNTHENRYESHPFYLHPATWYIAGYIELFLYKNSIRPKKRKKSLDPENPFTFSEDLAFYRSFREIWIENIFSEWLSYLKS